MAETALITATEVIDITAVGSQIDITLLEKHISKSQLKHIKPLVGEDLYETLQNETVAETYTGSNESLLTDYLKPALAHYTLYEALPLIRQKIVNKGIMIGKSEFSEGSDFIEFKYLRDEQLNNARFYAAEALKFICDNASDFSSYNLSSDSDYQGIYLY